MILCISFILWYVAIVFVLKGVRSHHALPSAAGGEGESFKQVVSGECLTQVWQCSIIRSPCVDVSVCVFTFSLLTQH